VVWQDGETFLGKRRTQDVAQEPGSGLVVESTGVGLCVHVESAVLHHELADDLRLATRREEHWGAFALGRACGR
jgi:hypothetical protein